MTDTQTKNFLGIPIEGDPTYRDKSSVPQKSAEELHAALTKVLSHPGIEAVAWSQYTPYFNDGDICEFGINEPRFKLTAIKSPNDGLTQDDDAYDWDDEFDGYEGGGFIEPYDWSGPANIIGSRHYDRDLREYVIDETGDESLVAAMVEFQNEFGDAYEDVLLDNFGDHAKIVATADKISIEFYEHD